MANMIQIVEDRHMTGTVQIKFPRSKKKRIRKKWAKNPKFFIVKPSEKVVVINGFFTTKYICHPIVAKKLRQELDEINKRAVFGFGGYRE